MGTASHGPSWIGASPNPVTHAFMAWGAGYRIVGTVGHGCCLVSSFTDVLTAFILVRCIPGPYKVIPVGLEDSSISMCLSHRIYSQISRELDSRPGHIWGVAGYRTLKPAFGTCSEEFILFTHATVFLEQTVSENFTSLV